MTTIKLTEEQRELVRSDMYEKTTMLSDEEVEMIASKLNSRINIPFIPESVEQIVFVKTVRLIDSVLYANLPNELYGLIKETTDGISEQEAAELKQVLGARLNKSIDIPYIPEWIEQQIFEMMVGLIVQGMRRGFCLSDACGCSGDKSEEHY